MVIEITNSTDAQWYSEAIGQKFYAFDIPSFPYCYFVSFCYGETNGFELIVHKNDCKVITNVRN